MWKISGNEEDSLLFASDMFGFDISESHANAYIQVRINPHLDIVENVGGDCTKVDVAEQHVIDEPRKMANASAGNTL